MPAYSFEALDAQGDTLKGVLEADTAKAARSQLRAQSLVPQAARRSTARKSYLRNASTVYFLSLGFRPDIAALAPVSINCWNSCSPI